MAAGAIRTVDRILQDEEEKRRRKAREEAEKWAAERPVPAPPRPAPSREEQFERVVRGAQVAVQRTVGAIEAVGAAQREREVIAGPDVTPTPTPTKRRGVPLAQLPLAAPERAAVERGELGGPPSGPSIVELALWTPIVTHLAVAAPALALKFPILAAFLVEQQAEEAGIIPGRPVGRAIEFLAEPGKQNLEDLGVPEGAASILSELTLFGAIGKAPTGQRTLPELMAAVRQLSKEDVAKAVRAAENIVLRGEAGMAGKPKKAKGKRVEEPAAVLAARHPPPAPRVARLEEIMASGEAFQPDPARRVAEAAALVPGVKGVLNIAVGPSATARGNVLAEAWIAWNRQAESFATSVKLGVARLRGMGRVFDVTKTGQVRNIRVGYPDGWTGPRTRHISDVMERWGVAFTGTPEQDALVRTGWRLIDDAVVRYEAIGGNVRKLGLERVGAHYWPRQVFSIRNINMMNKAATGGRLGRKPLALTRHRMHDFAEEGVAAGVDYNTDIVGILETTLNGIARATADQELINLVARQGRTALSIVPLEIKEATARASRRLRWLDKLLDYARGNLRGRPATPVLRASKIHGAPPPEMGRFIGRIAEANKLRGKARTDAIRAIRDEVKAIRDAARLARDEARRTQTAVREHIASTGALPGRFFGRPAEEAIAVTQVGGKLPSLGGRIFTAEDGQFLIDHWADIPGVIPRTAGTLSGIVRVGQTAFDPGFWFIQGLGPLGTDLANFATGRPTAIWMKAVFRSLEALASPNAHQRYLADMYARHPATMERFARYVGGISWSEFTEQARVGGALYRVPILGPSSTRAAQFFDGYLNAAMIESWRAVEPLAKGNAAKYEQLGAWVRNISGTLSASRLGQTPTQKMIEGGFILYAPRYRRAGMALAWDAFWAFLNPGSIKARQSLKSLAGILAATHLMFIGAAKATGMHDDEIVERLKPWSGGRYLTLEIGGNSFGVGGVTRSLTNMIGRLVITSVEEPEDFLNWMPQDWNENPIIKSVRSAGPPVPGSVYDVLSGETFLGERFNEWQDYQEVGIQWLPFWLAAGLQADGSLKDRFLAATAEFGGLRSYPTSPWRRIDFEIKQRNITNSQGERIEHWRDLTQPQKIELEQDEDIAGLLKQAEGRAQGPFARANELNEKRAGDMAWAADTLRAVGPTPDALGAYAATVEGVKTDYSKRIDEVFREQEGRDVENPDIRLYRDWLKEVGTCRRVGDVLDGECYGQKDHDFRQIIGPEQEVVLDEQISADRDPQVQYRDKLLLAFGKSGYYDINEVDGTPDSSARLQWREGPDNAVWDAIGYLLGNFPSGTRTDKATAITEELFRQWMAGEEFRRP